MNKLPSGRFCFMITCCICLLMLTGALVFRGEEFSLGKPVLAAIISSGITAYYHKNREKKAVNILPEPSKN